MANRESASSWGCELKCECKNENPIINLSASSWGCELKCRLYAKRLLDSRSASSWGCELKCNSLHQILCSAGVSLFVRLWVEIVFSCVQAFQELVSLFVRLWVEMFHQKTSCSGFRVSLFVRLWVEILCESMYCRIAVCQPLREAVSWNGSKTIGFHATFPSASSWGCELKFIPQLRNICPFLSASSWGCELKFREMSQPVR